MRGAILMSLLALCAALSLHYLRAVSQARAVENGRSDPLVIMSHAFPNVEVGDETNTPPDRTATVDSFSE